MVSTEDPEIKAVSQEWGAEVVDRPPELATDEALSRDVIRHALEATGADVSVLLQPTSPVRDDDLIDRVIAKFLADPSLDSMSTGAELPVYPPHGQEHRRQDIEYRFVNDGSVFISTAKTVFAGSLFGKNAGTFITDREQNIDIDGPFDFDVAEIVLERRQAKDPETMRRNRDEYLAERFGLGLHFLKAVIDLAGHETAREVAARAFEAHVTDAWGRTFEGLGEAGRIQKLLGAIEAMPAESNPDLEILSRTKNRLEVVARDCAASRLFKKHGLFDYLHFYCEQDPKVARMASPGGRVEIDGLLSFGQDACRQVWIFWGDEEDK